MTYRAEWQTLSRPELAEKLRAEESRYHCPNCWECGAGCINKRVADGRMCGECWRTDCVCTGANRYIDNMAPATVAILVVSLVVCFGLCWYATEKPVRWL